MFPQMNVLLGEELHKEDKNKTKSTNVLNKICSFGRRTLGRR